MDIQGETIRLNSRGVSELLRTGADVNAPGGEYGSAIQAAGQLGRDAILELLLNSHADINCSNVGTRNPHGRTPLSLAAGSGHSSVVRQLLARDDINADSTDDDGRTPLSWAAGSGESIVAIEVLLERSDVHPDTEDNNGRTPLSWAAGNGRASVVELLLKQPNINADARDRHGRTPLSWAAGNGHHGVMNLLLAREDVNPESPDSDGRTPLSWAAGNGQVLVMELLLKKVDVDPNRFDNHRMTPLSWAAREGQSKVVEILLKRSDVDPNSTDKDGIPPLWWAAKEGHYEVVKLLLAKENIDINYEDSNGRTLLSKVAENGSDGVVRMLLSREGLSPDSPDTNGRTALSWAAGTGHGAIVELLLKRTDVDANSEDNFHQTPLLWAAKNGRNTVVRILLAMEEVNPNTTDDSGRTPLLWALDNGHNAVMRALIDRDKITLHTLLRGRFLTAAEVLLAGGYDADRCDAGSPTALRLALRIRDREAIDLLLRYGAQTKGIMANDWLAVYGRERTDIIQLVEGVKGGKRVEIVTKDTVANMQTFPSLERHIIVFPDNESWPKNLLSGGTKKIHPNEFRVSYEDINGHAIGICVSLWFPAGQARTQQHYFSMPDWGESRIAWTVQPPANPQSRPWKSTTFFSTLANAWIPDDGADFFLQFIHHMEERWLRVCDAADSHLRRSRLDQLRSEGKSPELMRRLAKDAQKWTELRSILQDHTDAAQKFIVEYCERYNANQIPNDLQKSVEEFKVKIGNRISQLDQTIRDLLQFEFAWASINESRVSTRLGQNVMLFTYVSIFYLPLAFCAAIWAIPNISDSDTRNPFIITSVIVGFVTLFISFNLENIAGLVQRSYNVLRVKLVQDMEQDTHHWRQRGEELGANTPSNRETSSDWWLLGYLAHQLVVTIRAWLSSMKWKKRQGETHEKKDDASSC